MIPSAVAVLIIAVAFFALLVGMVCLRCVLSNNHEGLCIFGDNKTKPVCEGKKPNA
jgi:hypothetical protein